MKICAIIPDRGDRPQLLEKCMHYLDRQTLRADCIWIVDHEPKDNTYDLTKRIGSGYNLWKDQYDVFAIIENDDWYAPEYIEAYSKEWDKAGRPDLFGSDHTYYYHVKKNKHRVMAHPNRSSLFTTWIKGGLDIDWPKDDDLQLDMKLWGNPKLSKATTKLTLAVGIKHGIGLCGGIGHTTMRYDKDGAPPPLYLSKDMYFYDQLSKTL